jgi:hypothetical protein
MCVDIGCRWVYEPELLPGEAQVHVWSFMQPQLTRFQLNGQYATGEISIASGVVTGVGTTFPAWAAAGEIVVGGITYSVASRSSDTELVLDDTSINVSSTTYTLQQVNYVLPDLFGGFRGDLVLNSSPGTHGEVLQRTTKEAILAQQNNGLTDFSTTPCQFAVFPQDQTGESGARWLLTVWPAPDSAYTVSGYYTINPYQLTSSLPYPMGGLPLSECLREAVLGAAEIEFQGQPGAHVGMYQRRLQAAVSFDRQMSNPGIIGQNRDLSVERRGWERNRHRARHIGLGPTEYSG